MIEIESAGAEELRPRISVIGVGGAGGNAVDNMIADDVIGVEFLVANTDAQALNASQAGKRIQLGRSITQGLGAGSVAAVGKAAAEESIEEIIVALQGVHMCFIAAGMGGGTGTGAAPVIAQAAREMGILTIGVVTKPFTFEGSRRNRTAEAGIEELERHVDTLIVVPNQNLFRVAGASTTIRDAFRTADEVLQQGVRGITDLMVMPGLVNLDFADLQSVMSGMGKAMMGTGEASGDKRAIEAAEIAISNPLLDGALKGARGVIISITGGEDMRLMEMDEAAGHIKDLIDPEADIIWGSAINPEMKGRMRISIVATGLAVHPTPSVTSLPVKVSAAAVSADPAPAMLVQSAEDEHAGRRSLAPVRGFASAPAATALDDELQTCTDDLWTMFLPDAKQVRPTETIAPAIPDGPPPHSPSLFERMAGLARGAAKAELKLEGTALVEEPGFYNRRAGGYR
jgi:cell division protein FtsZ